MSLQIVLPEENVKDSTTKDLVFSILIDDKPKTLTQLHREIKRKYKVSVTFQAVLKAVRILHSRKVLSKRGRHYSLNERWVFETRKFFDGLYKRHFKVKRPMEKVEAGAAITVYTVGNLLELDRIWNDLLTNWAKYEKEDKTNVWMGRHCWWLIPRLEEEDILHDFMTEKGVVVYNVVTGDTPLDKAAVEYYKSKKEYTKIVRKARTKADSHIAAFGDTTLKFEIPPKLSQKLERVYMRTKHIGDLNLKKTLDVYKENHNIEVTLIRDRTIAGKVKEDVVSYF
ncbi:MAG: hypothetical protein ABIG39_07310 [Candidatus Micrarchaeota archaeon]